MWFIFFKLTHYPGMNKQQVVEKLLVVAYCLLPIALYLRRYATD